MHLNCSNGIATLEQYMKLVSYSLDNSAEGGILLVKSDGTFDFVENTSFSEEGIYERNYA